MRKFLKKLHLWIGLIFCAPLVLMGLTGSILIFEREVKNFSAPKYSLQNIGEKHSVGEIVAAASKAAPQGAKPNMFRAAKNDKAASIRFSSSDKKTVKKTVEIAVDPISLEVLEINDFGNDIFKIIEQLHTNLLLKDYGGRSIVGWFGVALLTLSLSGIIIWFPKVGSLKSGLFLQKNLQGFNFHRNLHKVFGFWSFVFLLIMSFAGIYLAFPKQMNSAFSVVFSTQNFAKNIGLEVAEGAKPMSVDEVVKIAQNSIVEGKLSAVIFPGKPNQPYRINFSQDLDYEDGQPLATIFVNQFSGEILESRNPEKYSAAEKFMIWQKPLHTAQGLGAIWYVPIFFVGLLPAVFAITGWVMWLKKRRK